MQQNCNSHPRQREHAHRHSLDHIEQKNALQLGSPVTIEPATTKSQKSERATFGMCQESEQAKKMQQSSTTA